MYLISPVLHASIQACAPCQILPLSRQTLATQALTGVPICVLSERMSWPVIPWASQQKILDSSVLILPCTCRLRHGFALGQAAAPVLHPQRPKPYGLLPYPGPQACHVVPGQQQHLQRQPSAHGCCVDRAGPKPQPPELDCCPGAVPWPTAKVAAAGAIAVQLPPMDDSCALSCFRA